MPAYGKVKVDTITYDLSGTATDVSVSNIATKASPTFTGTVTVPTPTAGDNSTKAASTAFVVASFATKASPTFTGTINAADLVLSGDLTVNGSTTTIDTTTLQVEDKNIQIGKVSTPSDVTADGGGLTLLGATNKTWNWVNSTDAWTSSEHIHLGDNKKLLVGTGSDLSIYHDTNNSFISSITGNLKLVGNANIVIEDDQGDTLASFNPNSSVDLYHNNVKKIETTSSGINVTGAISVNGAALSTAPQIEATADGAITAGKPCIITVAGKAKQVAESTFGSNSLVFNSGSQANLGSDITPAAGYSNTAAYDDDSDTVALAYKNSSNALKVKLFSTSGNGLTEIVEVTPVNVASTTSLFGICKLSSRRFALTYWDAYYGGTGRMMIKILTVNSAADGMSIGAEADLDGAGAASKYGEPHVFAIGDNRIAILCHALNSNCRVSQPKVALIVGDITSGDTYTYRSYAQITSDSADGQYRSIGYDSTNDVVGVAFTNSSNEVKFVGCKVAAGTGAAITQGTAMDMTTGGNKPNIKWHSNSGSWITACAHSEGSPTVTSLRVQAHTINSGTLAITSGTAINNTTQGYPAYMVDICISNQHIIYFNYSNATKNVWSLSATVSGTTLTLNTSDIAEQLPGSSSDKLAAEFMAHNDKIVMFARISGNYIYGTGNTTSITSNLTTENYVGLAAAAANNNATATVDVSGATNTSQSSLTPGQKYYVQGDGTLGLTADTIKVFAGTAVAATKLIVNDQQPMPPDAEGWTVINKGTCTAGATAVVINESLSSTYALYKVQFYARFSSNSTKLGLEIKTGGNWEESNYWYQIFRGRGTTGTTYTYSSRDKILFGNGEDMRVASGKIDFGNVDDTTHSKVFKINISVNADLSNYDNPYVDTMSAGHSSTTAITGIRFKCTDGTFSAGWFVLEGLKI